jgi:hypothetical protein
MSEEVGGNGQESELPEKVEGSPDQPDQAAPLKEPEVLKELPPGLRKAVESFSLQAFSGPVFHPALAKINERHIDKVLDQADKDSERNFQDSQSSRKYRLIVTIIILIFLAGMTVFLVQADKELYKHVLNLLLPFLAGLAGGYGLKAYQDRDKE